MQFLRKEMQILHYLTRQRKLLDLRIEKAYLFGSHANGTADEWSDIDVALVSNDFIGIRFFDKERLSKYILEIDSRLETHPYRSDEFDPQKRWFVQEILDHGIEIDF